MASAYPPLISLLYKELKVMKYIIAILVVTILSKLLNYVYTNDEYFMIEIFFF